MGAKYESIRASQLYGMSGFDNEVWSPPPPLLPLLCSSREPLCPFAPLPLCLLQGRPVLVVRVGLSFQEPDIKVRPRLPSTLETIETHVWGLLCFAFQIEEYLHSHIQHNEYRDRILLVSQGHSGHLPFSTTCNNGDFH